MQKKILFLDLENTLMDTWENRNLCSNWRVIRNWIHFMDANEIHVFSYAIWNKEDELVFLKDIAPWLEDVLEINFQRPIMTVDMMRIICAQSLKIIMGKDDFFSFMKKDIAFRLICEQKFRSHNCILLDDMVEDSALRFSDGTVITTRDVKLLTGERYVKGNS